MRFGREIELCARRIASLALPIGRFVYQYDSDSRRQLPGYNVLRHCGAIWAVNGAVAAGMAPPETAAALHPAILSVIDLQTGRGPTGSMFVHERGEVKLGANALAVLALCTTPDGAGVDRADIARRLCAYIDEQADGADDFIHKRQYGSMAVLPFRSDYYTGEALFAVVVAARLLRDEGMLEGAERRILSLAARGYGEAEQSHWMMYAAGALQDLRPNVALAGYARRLTRAILDNPGYRARGACTPIACRTEALLAAVTLLRAGSSADGALLGDARGAIEENLAMQLTCMERDGGFRRDPQTPVVRIDYIQHNLACLVSYEQVFD